jgi:6-phosphogluconolactonase
MASTAIEPSQASDPVKGAGKDTLVYIGTHTSEKGQGIYLFRLQSAGSEVFQNVTLVPLGLAVETPSPTHFELDRPHRRLFTVNQIDQFEGKPTGAVSAYAINAAGLLTRLNQRSSLGTRPCDLVIDKDGRHLIVANCANGSIAVFPVADDGMLAEASQMIDVAQRDAAGATDRAPCVALDPANRFVFVCDPSSARIRSYMFDTERGKLTPTGQIATALKPGPTPRQMRFRHDARFAYLLNEQSTVTVFAYDSTTGNLTEVQTVSTLPEYFDGANVSGELYIHRSGKWLYASNIGHNSIALFTIDAERGTLTFVEEQGTGGKTPRQFGIEPSSKHLAISNRDSHTVLASRIDEGNGRLKPSGIFADVPSPAAIRFLPPPETGQ